MFAPGLSMLWETVDAESALRDRFGLSSFDSAKEWLGAELANTWMITLTACERVVISGDNAIAWVATDRGALIVKWSRASAHFDRLIAVAELLRHLSDEGLPVAAPVPSRNGHGREVVHSGSTPLSMTVQPLVEGELLDTSDLVAVQHAGATLARLHFALARHGDERLAGARGGPPAAEGPRILSWLDDHDHAFVPAASARLRDLVAGLPEIDGEPQLIHRDYRAANILTRGSEVTVVLDFDETTFDHRVVDLANSFVRLGTRFTDWRPTPARARAALLDGYQAVSPLTALQLRWLDAITLWFDTLAVAGPDDPGGWAAAL